MDTDEPVAKSREALQVRSQENCVRVGDSTIEGLGVFANRAFTPNERILAIDDSHTVEDERALPKDQRRHCDFLAHGRVVLMQAPERHINHSCDPNSFVQTINGTQWVIARGLIAKDEEITYDYSINSGGDTVWQCHCQAARCRRNIHSNFFHLPLQLQREYLPLLDSWFRLEHAAEIDAIDPK